MSNPRETLTRLISAISSSDIPGFAEALGSSPGFLNEKLDGTSMTGEHAALCTIYARFREGVISPDVAIELIQQLQPSLPDPPAHLKERHHPHLIP